MFPLHVRVLLAVAEEVKAAKCAARVAFEASFAQRVARVSCAARKVALKPALRIQNLLTDEDLAPEQAHVTHVLLVLGAQVVLK